MWRVRCCGGGGKGEREEDILFGGFDQMTGEMHVKTAVYEKDSVIFWHTITRLVRKLGLRL